MADVPTAADPVMSEIIAATALFRGGERVRGRLELESIWARIAVDPEPMHECALAHALADAQDDPAEELAWDLRALDAAHRCTDEDVRRHNAGGSIAGFMPSLHANLAEAHLKLGELATAKEHLALARSFVGDLQDDGYGRMVRGGIESISGRLAATGEAAGLAD
jgi:hypothetical protein